MEAAVTPLPTEETTPPVQKMNLTISTYGESTKPRSVLPKTLHISPYNSLPTSLHFLVGPKLRKSYHNSVPLSTRALDFTANQACFTLSSSSSERETSPYRTRM